MADLSNITHIDISGATIEFHCVHNHGTTSWRLSGVPLLRGGTVYFTGTVTDLRAFGESMLRAADAHPSRQAPVATEQAVQ